LDEVALEIGVAGGGKQQRERHDREREEYRLPAGAVWNRAASGSLALYSSTDFPSIEHPGKGQLPAKVRRRFCPRRLFVCS
jgi:hypothetical protein